MPAVSGKNAGNGSNPIFSWGSGVMDTLFYAEPGSITSSHIHLEGDEAKHASRVLRCRVGDPMEITDGLGTRFYGNVKSVTRSEVVVSIEKRTRDLPSAPCKVLAIGLIRKRERLEFLLEKATELGIDHFILFSADHSEKVSIRSDRLSAVLLRAMKQSRRTYLPGISSARSLDEVVTRHVMEDEASQRPSIPAVSRRLIYGDISAISTNVIDTIESTTEVEEWMEIDEWIGLIGPEGGWSSRELSLLHAARAIPILLGSHRLRTETAGIIMADRLANIRL